MPARVLAIAPPALAARFERAAGAEPLCALAPADRAELDALLAATTGFEDLPGRWQAALLAAEAGGASAPAGCCAHA